MSAANGTTAPESAHDEMTDVGKGKGKGVADPEPMMMEDDDEEESAEEEEVRRSPL
jgi:hypothetical protein